MEVRAGSTHRPQPSCEDSSRVYPAYKLGPSFPALATSQWPSRRGGSHETSIKLGCGSGPDSRLRPPRLIELTKPQFRRISRLQVNCQTAPSTTRRGHQRLVVVGAARWTESRPPNQRRRAANSRAKMQQRRTNRRTQDQADTSGLSQSAQGASGRLHTAWCPPKRPLIRPAIQPILSLRCHEARLRSVRPFRISTQTCGRSQTPPGAADREGQRPCQSGWPPFQSGNRP